MGNKYHTPWHSVTTARGLMLVSGNNNTVDFESPFVLTHVLNCVNACAGMDDPVAEVARIKSRLKLASELLDKSAVRVDKSGNGTTGYHMTIEATPSALRGDISSSVESPYTSRMETLQKAVDEVREGGFTSKIDHSDYAGGTDHLEYLKPVTPPSWHELGIFPPVGTVCEMQDDAEGWLMAEIIAHKSRYAFGWCAEREMVYFSSKLYEFRPLQTEKQKTIKAMLPVVAALDGTQSAAEIACEKIYDQFIAKKVE